MMRQRMNTYMVASAVGAVLGLGGTAFGQCTFWSDTECDFVESAWGPYDNTSGSTTTDPNNLIAEALPILGLDGNGVMFPLSVGQTAKVNGKMGRWDVTDEEGNITGVDSDTDWYKFRLTEPARCIIWGIAGNKDGDGIITPWSYNAETGEGNRFRMFVYAADGGDQFFGASSRDPSCLEAKTRLPNGSQASYLYLPAGEYAVGFDTTWAEPADATNPADANYAGPVEISFQVQNIGLGNTSCGVATNACDAPGASPGCKDIACCDLVCQTLPDCCDVAWDESCFDQGVADCGLFRYACDVNGPNPNDCVSNFQWIDMGDGQAKQFAFNLDGATTDGPNDVTRLCGSPMGRDVWYLVGPMPADGNINISMCTNPNNPPEWGLPEDGLTPFDTVMDVYANPDYSVLNGIGDPSNLPADFLGCADDSCDFDGDGEVNFAGPTAIGVVNASAGDFFLVRVGSFYDAYDGETPADAPVLAGGFDVSFVSEPYYNGGSDLSYLGGSYAWYIRTFGRNSTTVGSTAPQDCVVAFTLDQETTFDHLAVGGTPWDGAGYVAPQTIRWKIVTRPQSVDPDTGASQEGFEIYADSVFDVGVDEADILLQGDAPFTLGADPRDVYTQYYGEGVRSKFDVGDQVMQAGDYWLLYTGNNPDTTVRSAIASFFGAAGGTIWGITLPAPDGTDNPFEPLIQRNGPLVGSTVQGSTLGTSGEYRFGQYFRPGLVVTESTEVPDTYVLDESGAIFSSGLALYGLDYEGDPVRDYVINFAMTMLQERFAEPCPGDLDGSSAVDAGDIGFLLTVFGECPGGAPNCTGDLDGSGAVDAGDIGFLLTVFGPCPGA